MPWKRCSYKYKATMIRGQGGATAVPKLFYFVLLNGWMRWWNRSVFSLFVGDFFKTSHSIWEKHIWPLRRHLYLQQPLTKCGQELKTNTHSRLGSPLWRPILTTFIHNCFLFIWRRKLIYYIRTLTYFTQAINVLIKVDCGADTVEFQMHFHSWHEIRLWILFHSLSAGSNSS